MKTVMAAIFATLMLIPAARADDVEATIEAALKAYRAGDVETAREELGFATQLLGQMKADALQAFLPEPLDGWERQDASHESAAMPAFGGGQMASASYVMGDQTVEIQLMADNPMVTAMAGMFSGAAMMGAMGQVQRISGEKVVLTPDGEMQAMIDGRILVNISGSADDAAKSAYFEAIDLAGLKEF